VKSVPSFTAFVLETRYTFGYLAAGFLVSTPLWILSDPGSDWSTVPYSLLYGIACLVVYFLFGPLAKADWKNLKLPEFKLFELSVTRWSCLLSFVFMLVLAIHPRLRWQWRLGLLQFLVMLLPYLRIKLDTWLFKDFYEIEEKERRRVVRARERLKVAEATATAAEASGAAPFTEAETSGGGRTLAAPVAVPAAAAATAAPAAPPVPPMPGPTPVASPDRKVGDVGAPPPE